ncbi:MAG: hypothetical protein K0V04_22415 [Deltaproteobacteria bacterium]|nr:hypothetical protein [Deltaproteobacteria bacterium]
MSRAFVAGASEWSAEAGPPRAELLTRTQRAGAEFCTRILAHVIAEATARALVEPSTIPWVLGSAVDSPSWLTPDAPLRRALQPSSGVGIVHAGPGTAAMCLVEAIALVDDSDAVLVALAQDATSPYHEALAVAFVLTAAPREGGLVLETPVLRRTRESTRRTESEHPLKALLDVARAVSVGQPTVQTVAPGPPDRPERWQIELGRPF